MKEKTHLLDLIAKFPTPAMKDGKLADADKEAMDSAVRELLKVGRPAVVGLIALLVPAEMGGDTQARHAIHAIVIHVGGSKESAPKQALAEALASTFESDRPKEIKAFVLRQLQLVGGKEVSETVGKFLLDTELGESAAQTLLAIKSGAAAPFRIALAKTAGRQRLLMVHGLGTLRDVGAVEPLKKLLADEDRDTRVTAAWALANIGDAGSAEALLKLADDAQGFERTKATQASLLLAEKLLSTGKKKEAARIYGRLHEARSDPSEGYVKEAAARGLQATK
jgi:HEAT repeat protein